MTTHCAQEMDRVRDFAAALTSFAGRIHQAVPTIIHQRINVLAKSMDI